MNNFIRGYVGGKLFGPETQAQQTDLFIPGGESGPPGPGMNSASLALFRYETPCGTVYGHTGNTPGYTQFMVASPDGTRSATMAMTLARNADGIPGGTPGPARPAAGRGRRDLPGTGRILTRLLLTAG